MICAVRNKATTYRNPCQTHTQAAQQNVMQANGDYLHRLVCLRENIVCRCKTTATAAAATVAAAVAAATATATAAAATVCLVKVLRSWGNQALSST
ncbi:hypothetical protein ElyMa_007025300 [Elysia marginata]|uniref:Uncharacterized protein n=1 Tax=Elysia marginata TaxID=1093978 RepID=A0AAV4JUH9_9GAST|nr:hypothetical protein ElyMa_007025300 [Elysia marginata]